MTIREYIKEYGWQSDCVLVPGYQYVIVHVEFINDEDNYDATSFDIEKHNVDSLDELYDDFCYINRFPTDTVTEIAIVASAVTMEELQKIDL